MQHLKKYPNRRLYNTNTSKYITVEQVRLLIVGGESITVEDSSNGKDITRTILLQILADQEAEGHEPVLTNRAIEQIIRFYGNKLGGMVSRYIEQSILTFIDHQDQFRARLRQLNELNPLNIMRQAFDDPTKVGRRRNRNEPTDDTTDETSERKSDGDKPA